MKKLTVIVVAFIFSLAISFAGATQCLAEKSLTKEEEARAALRKKVLEKKEELNGTSWAVEIKSQTGRGDFMGSDTLTFQNEKFRSATGEKNGFGATNYTLTVQEEGPTIWETMQTGKKGEIAFWRGEWKDDVMTGVISRQLEKGNEEYYFSSSSMKSIPKIGDEDETDLGPISEPEAKPAVLGGATTPAQSTPTKKKTSWFF